MPAAWYIALPQQLAAVFYTVVLPVLLLAGVGYVLQRALGLDMATLKRLNFYFIIPCLIYVSIVQSTLSGGDVIAVVLFTLAMVACMSAAALLAARLRGVPADQRSCMLMTVIFHNSGNYGLTLQRMAFGGSPAECTQAVGLQAFVMLTQNFVSFTLGVFLAAAGRGGRSWRGSLAHIAKFPPVYALAAGWATVLARSWLAPGGPPAGAAEGVFWPALTYAVGPFWKAAVCIKEAFFALALCTLGAQLALVARGARRYPVTLSVLLRLLAAPAVAMALLLALGLKGLPAQVLLIGMSTPTAVNCMLLCLEFDNHPDYAARAVFYSTVISPVTVTLVVFLARTALPGAGLL